MKLTPAQNKRASALIDECQRGMRQMVDSYISDRNVQMKTFVPHKARQKPVLVWRKKTKA